MTTPEPGENVERLRRGLIVTVLVMVVVSKMARKAVMEAVAETTLPEIAGAGG